MKISVMGIEYNHLLSGKALAEMGNEVTYISKDNRRINNIKRGYYNSDEAMVIKNLDIKENIGFSTDVKAALSNTNMCFISEGITNEESDNMEEILNAAKVVGENMSSHLFIVDRSDASQSRIGQIKETIQEALSKRKENITFEVIANPDFLRN